MLHQSLTNDLSRLLPGRRHLVSKIALELGQQESIEKEKLGQTKKEADRHDGSSNEHGYGGKEERTGEYKGWNERDRERRVAEDE